jgi:hypothetical protein
MAKSLSQAGLALSLISGQDNCVRGLSGLSFPFSKSFINSHHFNSNSNLNFEQLLHAKQNMGALQYTIKYATDMNATNIIIYSYK